jgi:ABC-2 type transport system ATP-binding protein
MLSHPNSKEISMIQVNGLIKDYGARRAIDNLQHSMPNREKSSGFLVPTAQARPPQCASWPVTCLPLMGSAIVAGYDVVEESLEVRKRVGYLPETVPFTTDMTAVDYLKIHGRVEAYPKCGRTRL